MEWPACRTRQLCKEFKKSALNGILLRSDICFVAVLSVLVIERVTVLRYTTDTSTTITTFLFDFVSVFPVRNWQSLFVSLRLSLYARNFRMPKRRGWSVFLQFRDCTNDSFTSWDKRPKIFCRTFLLNTDVTIFFRNDYCRRFKCLFILQRTKQKIYFFVSKNDGAIRHTSGEQKPSE